jgi:hypothetical protein
MDAGFVLAASYEDSAGSGLNDGVMVRRDVLRSRSEEMPRFLRALYRATAELSNDALRFDFAMRWYTENGRAYTRESLEREIRARRYITPEAMTVPGYALGAGLIEVSRFFGTTGQIEQANLPNVPAAMNATFLREALGINVRTGQ